ncbi:MAG TPA: hypothetical protein VFQ30_02475 [Ktedonobacteraceae bacterium]|nr:hypothetical protein [Ktedonobacteraceae bacterium]
MGLSEGYLAVGVFHEAAQARRAIEDLHQAGYSDDEIGYLARVSVDELDERIYPFITDSAVEGGLLGGLLGAAVALLIPGLGPAIAGGVLVAELGSAALGAAAGGLLGVLIDVGFPEEEAHHYQKALEAGCTVLTVKAPRGDTEVLHILRRNGASEATSRLSKFNALPPLRP